MDTSSVFPEAVEILVPANGIRIWTVNNLPTNYQQTIPTTFQQPTDNQTTNNLQTTYQQLTNNLPATYQQLTNNLPTTHQQPTNNLPTTYQQPTNNLTTT